MAGRPVRVAPVLLVLALMTAALLRLIDLGGPSLWDDELSTVRFCEQPAGAIVGLSVFLDVNPPLFYLLQHAWQALVPPGEYGWRLLAALLGLLNVALIYLYGRELAGERPALLAAWIAAISPQHVYSSQEVRSQTALLALLLAAAWCLARLERDGRARWGAAAGLATAAALWTHYYALFFAAAWFGYALWRTLGRAWDRPRRRAALAWVFSAGLLFAPGALILLIQLQGGQGWRPEQPLWRVLTGWGLSLTSGLLPWGASTLLGDWLARDQAHSGAALLPALLAGAPALLLMLYGLRKLRRPGLPPAAAFICWWLLGPILLVAAVCLFTPLFDPRHALISLPPAALLLGLGAEHLLTKPRRGLRLLGAAALAWIALLGLLGNLQLRAADACQRQDWRGLAERMIERAEPGDVALAHMQHAALCLDYYDRGRVPLRWIFEWLPRPEAIQENPLAMTAAERERRVEQAVEQAQQAERIWLLDYHNRAFDPSGSAERLLSQRYVPIWSEHRLSGAYRYGLLLLSRRPDDVVAALAERVEFGRFTGPPLQLDAGWFDLQEWTWAASQSCVLLRADHAPGVISAEVYVPYELLGDRPFELRLATATAETTQLIGGPQVLTVELPQPSAPPGSAFWACLESGRSFVPAADPSGRARAVQVRSIGWAAQR